MTHLPVNDFLKKRKQEKREKAQKREVKKAITTITTGKYHKIENPPQSISVLFQNDLFLLPGNTVSVEIDSDPFLDLVSDSLKQERLIGVTQRPDNKKNKIFRVGCIGKIQGFEETEDGFLIELKGICRFNMEKIIQTQKKYYKALINYDRFYRDLFLDRELVKEHVDRRRLLKGLIAYFKIKTTKPGWDKIADCTDAEIILALTTAAEFSTLEKQAILELPTITEQCCFMTSLIEMDALDLYGYMRIAN